MARVSPFRAWRYALSRIPIEKVVTQPYDKISKEMQERYYALHPHNLIRIVLGKPNPEDGSSDNVYTRAAASLEDWRHSGVLEPVAAPAFYAYFQRFTIPGTNEVLTRKGFVGLGQLEDYANKIVFPHERTLTGPKKDRLELLRHTRTHFEQIFMLYEDPQQQIDQVLETTAASRPEMEVQDEYGVTHRIWTISDASAIDLIQRVMSDKKLLIADGHHRYETALAYRDEMRSNAGKTDSEAAYEHLCMTFFNMDAPGIAILPTHRVVSNVAGFDAGRLMARAAEFFDIQNAPSNAEALRAELRRVGEQRPTIGVFTDSGNRVALLTLKPSVTPAEGRLLDVIILHRLVLDQCLDISEDAVKKESNITYVREMDAALTAVRSGKAQAAFLLNPTDLHQMRDIAYEGNVMPQKSTDFYPKVLSGLLMYSLNDRR
jgi:uncharacterized protein (DUF1015 family)